jgi:hypothetical protein
MRDKWVVRKKGYLKIHIVAVNVKTKKILSIKITNESVHDSKALPELVEENIIKSNVMSTTAIGKLFADDVAYDDNNIIRYLGDNGTQHCIKVRTNARIKLKTGHILENLSVLEQRNNLQRWKEDIM